MADLTFTAVVDESRVLHLPPEVPLGEVEVIVREYPARGGMAAILRALDQTPQASDPTIWQRAQEELLRSREED